MFHGNNKTYEELEMAVDYGVGRIVADNFYELEKLEDILKKKDKKINILMRVTPGVDGHTHDYIKTGQVDSKFGFSLHDDAAIRAVEKVLKSRHISLKGFHAHVGSQLLENEVYNKEIKILAEFSKKIKDLFSFEVEELNVGGGFGIYYTKGDTRHDASFFTDLINNKVTDEFKKNGLKRPEVIIEPGRWIAGEAGVTLYTVGSIKDIKGVRKYVSVDGGMADNPRPELYSALYSAVAANKIDETKKEVVTIAGKCCESGDILIKDIELPVLHSGDLLAVLSTGAYNYSMSSNYNRLRRPAVVMVKGGESRLAVKRETYEDLIRNDL
jgi:diaminopimelate decarboxylase